MFKWRDKRWKDYHARLKNANVKDPASHPVIQRAIAVNLRYDFLQHARKFSEYKLFQKCFLEHPYLLSRAKRRDGMLLSKVSEQYIYQACLLLREFPDMTGWTVLELGGGFGGFCHTLRQAQAWVRWSLVDAPEMLALARSFLGDTAQYSTIDDLSVLPDRPEWKFDLFVSNYCLTETTPDYVQYLTERVFPRCRRFFIIDGGRAAQDIQQIYRGWLQEHTRFAEYEYAALPHQKIRVHIGELLNELHCNQSG